ncbi:MAG: DUF6265 family protein [Flavobacteriales bacterium]
MFRYLLPSLASALFISCGTSTPPGPNGVPPSEDTLARASGLPPEAFSGLVTKLIGEWHDDQSVDKTVFHEHWDRTDDRSYVGLGFVMSGKDTSFIEHLSIHGEQGGVYYSARIPSQNEGASVDFRMTSASADSMVFENKEHDFPQRIVYATQADGTWKVNVSGPGKDGWRTDRYHFHRIGGSPD